MTEHQTKARELFVRGYNCAQAVFAAFSDVTGIPEEQSLKLASGFGAGMGGLREVCGAVSGMFMAADMLYGYTGADDKQGKAAHYALIKRLAASFKEENESLHCSDLLAHCVKAQQPMDRTSEYYGVRPCTRLVVDAVGILDEAMAARAAE